MAETSIPVQQLLSHDSVAAVFTNADAANNMTFKNTGNELLIITVLATATTIAVLGITDDNRRIGDSDATAITAETRLIGPFPINLYGQDVIVTFDQDTDVSVALVKQPV